MSTKATRIEVCTSDGTLLFTVNVIEKEIPSNGESERKSLTDIQPHRGNGNGKAHAEHSESQKDGKSTKSQTEKNDVPMTDAQKRLLFRILANKGMEGEKAHEHLKKMFQVSSLKDVKKLEASRTIEKLLDEPKGGQPSHATA
jgi:hypothetical protein